MDHDKDGRGHTTGPRRLVLCFDGTGNHYCGNESDTNIVKIYEMLDRFDPTQFHYYQPGIGTFTTGSSGSGLSFFGKTRAKLSQLVDQAIGTSFEYHVSAGYAFLMRYYQPGDYIYIFGFSRGAYTARFLSEMIHVIGLLSMGNEDMIRFAYSSFSEALQSRGKEDKSPKEIEHEDYMTKFKDTFCRPNVTVHFLGLFDCVNSVGQFEIPFSRQSYRYIAKPPAKHIRHAVSIHERRLKFKPALFLFEKDETSDLKEVWFAGNHSDVGGGFHFQGSVQHLLSDTPLAWMVDEVLALDDEPEAQLKFNTTNIQAHGHLAAGRATLYEAARLGHVHPDHHEHKKARMPHDSLKLDRGISRIGTCLWWILEILPFFTRLELEHGEWVPRYWPPNLGFSRDLPEDAIVHSSVQRMYNAGLIPAMPKLGGDSPPILQDPFAFLRRLLPWKLCKPSGAPLLQDSTMAGDIDSHGARSWSWGD